MSQQEIGQILEAHYPRFLFPKEIIELSGLSRNSVFKNLKAMKKRNEVQINLSWENKQAKNWKQSYRIKPEEKQNE